MSAPVDEIEKSVGRMTAVMTDAVAMACVLLTLKLPKGTRLVGTRAGTEVHRPDGVSYLVKAIPSREGTEQ